MLSSTYHTSAFNILHSSKIKIKITIWLCGSVRAAHSSNYGNPTAASRLMRSLMLLCVWPEPTKHPTGF